MKLNPIDFGEVLEEMGYIVQDDTGQVYVPASHTNYFEAQRFLVELVLHDQLIIDRDHLEMEMSYFIPHWKCFNSIQDYCDAYPNDKECLMYDV